MRRPFTCIEAMVILVILMIVGLMVYSAAICDTPRKSVVETVKVTKTFISREGVDVFYVMTDKGLFMCNESDARGLYGILEVGHYYKVVIEEPIFGKYKRIWSVSEELKPEAGR